MMNRFFFLLAVFALLFTGCASSYSWRPSVPPEMRTISVSTFRNESGLIEFGAISTRQILRELQREGTFKVCGADAAALEVQGIVKSVGSKTTAYSRRVAHRMSSGELRASVEVSVIDRRTNKVLIDSKMYRVRTNYVASQDASVAERDASGRLAEELARQVVDDLIARKW